MSRIISKYYNFDTSPENKSLILSSEQGNHKRLGFSVYYCSEDQIFSVARNEKSMVNEHVHFRPGITFRILGGEE